MGHFVQESMPCRLEEGKWLVGLAPAVVSTARISFRGLGIEEIFCSVIREKKRTQAESGREAVSERCGIRHSECIFAGVGLFAGNDEFQLESVARVAARAGLNAAKHVFHLGGVLVLEIMFVSAIE